MNKTFQYIQRELENKNFYTIARNGNLYVVMPYYLELNNKRVILKFYENGDKVFISDNGLTNEFEDKHSLLNLIDNGPAEFVIGENDVYKESDSFSWQADITDLTTIIAKLDFIKTGDYYED